MIDIDDAGLPLEFDVHDSITQEYMGTLDFSSWSFNDPLSGAGDFSGELAILPHQKDFLKEITTPWGYAIYVRYGETYLWGGPITARPWKRSSGMLNIQAIQWEGWLYSRYLQKKFIRRNLDQFRIVRNLVEDAISDVGCPPITFYSPVLSGINRDLTVDPWVNYGEAIDRVSSRSPGFDWAIQIRKSRTTGLPELHLGLWYPERRSLIDPLMYFESILDDAGNESGGNAQVDDWPDDSEGIVSRQWATGEGQPPDQPAAYDQNPALDSPDLKLVLLTEAVTNWTGVVKRTTLQEHAMLERKSKSASTQSVAINVSAGNPDVRDYSPGDRCRLVVRDRWVDEEYPAVRVIDRAIRGSRDEGALVTLVLDLNDAEAEQQDTGVDA